MINDMIKYLITNLSFESEDCRFQTDVTKDGFIIRGYQWTMDVRTYVPIGQVLHIKGDGSGFESLNGFKKIKNKNTKGKLLKLACEYCNSHKNKGGNNVRL